MRSFVGGFGCSGELIRALPDSEACSLLDSPSLPPLHPHHVLLPKVFFATRGSGTFVIDGVEHEMKEGKMLAVAKHSVHSGHAGDQVTHSTPFPTECDAFACCCGCCDCVVRVTGACVILRLGLSSRGYRGWSCFTLGWLPRIRTLVEPLGCRGVDTLL